MSSRSHVLPTVLLVAVLLAAGCASPGEVPAADATTEGDAASLPFCEPEGPLPVARDEPEPDVDDIIEAYAGLWNATSQEEYASRMQAFLAAAEARLRKDGVDPAEIEARLERSRAASEAMYAVVKERQDALRNISALAQENVTLDRSAAPADEPAEAISEPACLPLLGATGRGGAKSIWHGAKIKLKTNTRRWVTAGEGGWVRSHEGFSEHAHLQLLPASGPYHYEIRYGDQVVLANAKGEKASLHANGLMQVGTGTPLVMTLTHPHPMLQGMMRGKVVSGHDQVAFIGPEGKYYSQLWGDGLGFYPWSDEHTAMYFKIDDVGDKPIVTKDAYIHLAFEDWRGELLRRGSPPVDCMTLHADEPEGWSNPRDPKSSWSSTRWSYVNDKGSKGGLRYGDRVTLMGGSDATGRGWLFHDESPGWNCPKSPVNYMERDDGSPMFFVLVDPDEPSSKEYVQNGGAVSLRYAKGWLKSTNAGRIEIADGGIGAWERWTIYIRCGSSCT